MQTIVLKRSALTLLKKGLGKTNQEIADHFGITVKEAIKALESFGLMKGSAKKSEEPAYQISIVDDLSDTIGESVKKEVVEEVSEAAQVGEVA
jgi:hypothetical protein